MVAPDVPLLVSLYVFEGSALLLVLAGQRGGRLVTALSVVAGLALLGAAAVIVQRYRTRAGGDCQRVAFTMVLNLVSILLILATAELTLRLLARPTPRGPVVMDTHLLPWRWSDVVTHNQAILTRAARDGSYLVADENLGWVIGPNRRSADGLYFSSAEGLRSPSSGMAFRERTASRRIALVGDSFTFGLEGQLRRFLGASARASARPRRASPPTSGSTATGSIRPICGMRAMSAPGGRTW